MIRHLLKKKIFLVLTDGASVILIDILCNNNISNCNFPKNCSFGPSKALKDAEFDRAYYYIYIASFKKAVLSAMAEKLSNMVKFAKFNFSVKKNSFFKIEKRSKLYSLSTTI